MHRPLLLTIRIYLSWAIYLPIVGISYFIAWLDRQVQFRLAFPRDVDQLIQQQPWLIAELKKSAALPHDAVIDSCDIKPMNQAVIFRSNACIIHITYSSSGGQKAFKCFAKFAPTMGTVWNKTIFNLQLNHIKEAWFNQYFVNQDTTVPAPKMYCSKVSIITGHLCLITELMSDDIEHRECSYESFPQEHLHLALDGMASLHARYWGDRSKRMARIMPIDDIAVHLFDSMVSGSWSIPARRVLVQSWTYMNQHQTVLHGDSRIGNMMFPASADQGRYVLIDWQAVRKGRAAYDVAYFLMLSLTTPYRRAWEASSIDSYYDLLVSKGVKNYSREEMQQDYRHATLCVLVLLSLPMLSGEASVEGDAAVVFVFGMNIWRERMVDYFSAFDYAWMARQYAMTEQQARDAVSEMLTVIERRIQATLAASGTTEPIIDILKRHSYTKDLEV